MKEKDWEQHRDQLYKEQRLKTKIAVKESMKQTWEDFLQKIEEEKQGIL